MEVDALRIETMAAPEIREAFDVTKIACPQNHAHNAVVLRVHLQDNNHVANGSYPGGYICSAPS
jgi:hypothetical protein